MVRRTTSNVGATLSRYLIERGITQSVAASSSGTSKPYLNQIITGHRKAAPEWLDLIADTLKLSRLDREKLHRAGALDHGFKLDLTPPISSRKTS